MATFLAIQTIPTVAFIALMLPLLPPSLLAFVVLMQSFSFPIPYSSLESKYLFLTWTQWRWFCSCFHRSSQYVHIFPLDFYQPNEDSMARQLPAPSRSYRSHLYTTLMSAPTSQTRIIFVTISSCVYGLLLSLSNSSSRNFYLNLGSTILILLPPTLLQVVDFSKTRCNFLSKPIIPTIICYLDMLFTLAFFVLFFLTFSTLTENDVVVPLSVYLFFSSFALFFAALHYVAVALNFLIILLFVSSSFLEFIISYPIRLLCRIICKCR